MRRVVPRRIDHRIRFDRIQDLARKHQSDRNAYSNAKTEFVQSVLEAASVGLSSRTPV